MKRLWLIILSASIGFIEGHIPPPEESYKILMLLPVTFKSHRNFFVFLAEALAERGHKVVMLSNHRKAIQHQNITEIYHNLSYMEEANHDMFAGRNSLPCTFQIMRETLPRIARDLFNISEVKELYKRRKSFHLIIVDHLFNEVAYPFVHEMPFITIAAFGMEPKQSAVMGNPFNPAYMKTYCYHGELSTVMGRLRNVISHIIPPLYWREWEILPSIQKEITAQFPDLPPLLDLERNLSLTLMNSHFSLEMSLPLLPSQIEIGGMHCRPGKALPEDIKTWIEGAGTAGVVYFSLGSIAQGNGMPLQYRNMFIEAFSKLEQRVVWKFEEELQNVPENVLMRKWLPQQDILAHPGVKAFISHGGIFGIEEASYHGVPMLVLPIFFDQTHNAANIAAKERGLVLVWEELTVQRIVDSLLEIINNPKYKKNVMAASEYLRDQIQPPLERAVFWTEYVIRHKGAPMLRSPAADITWIEFLLLDVLVLVISLILGIFVILRLILTRIVFPAFLGSEMKKKID